MTSVSLTQQQFQQFIDSISGLEPRVATLQTHAEAQQEQIRVAEMLIQQLRTSGANPPPPTSARCCRSTRETISSTMIGPSVRDESSQELTRNLRDTGSGFLDRLMK